MKDVNKGGPMEPLQTYSSQSSCIRQIILHRQRKDEWKI